jgi:ATP-dependent Clp protease ATP-binding subunit ClpA
MPHAPFFSPEVADELLGEIDSSISRNKPAVPTETGIPLSAATKEVLQSALELMDATGREYVEPLHILGAILGQKELSPGAQIVQRAGITKEQAMAKLAEGND